MRALKRSATYFFVKGLRYLVALSIFTVNIIIMMSGLKTFVILVGFLVLAGCRDEGSQQTEVETQEEIDARTISQKDVEAIKYIDYELSADSQKAVGDWQKYKDLNTQIDFLKRADLSFFEKERELMITFTSEFRSEMPVPLKTKEISARITALDTKLRKLNSLMHLSTSTKEEKLNGIEELLIAFRNLKLQINKKFEFEKNNVLRPE